jgi:hypothetical protein
VSFASPERPIARLKKLTAREIAVLVLNASSSPLSPPEIRVQAKNLPIAWPNSVDLRNIANVLKPANGIYLLERGRYGVRRHFHLPEKLWPAAREAFDAALRKVARPVSTMEFLGDQSTAWKKRTNRYELVHILREDPRFRFLGRGLFSRAGWKLQPSLRLEDLVVRAVAEACRPLSRREIKEALETWRSIAPSSISNASLRSNARLVEGPRGHFALRGRRAGGCGSKRSPATRSARFPRAMGDRSGRGRRLDAF